MMQTSNLKIYKASAGSGKTHALTQEFLKLAFETPDKFTKILAVTFTNKAAEEMKERVIHELAKIVKEKKESAHFHAIHDTYPDFSEEKVIAQAKTILNNILHNYSALSISTIDSFVQRILKAFSFEIGIQWGYRIELDQAKVIRDLTDLLYKKLDSEPELLTWLVGFAKHRIDEGKNFDFREEIAELAGEIFKENFQSFAKSLKNHSKETLTNLFQEMKQIRNGFLREADAISERAVKICEKYEIQYLPKLPQAFKYIRDHLVKKLKQRNFEPNATVRNCLNNRDEWVSKSTDARTKDTVFSCYFELNPLLNRAIQLIDNEYTLYLSAVYTINNFHAFGILNDFSELLPEYRSDNNLLLISDTTLLLKEIISNNDVPFIYEKAGNKFKHILIDEFQDTSGFQWENFKPLIDNSLSEANFNLIVGDIKQSIYRWRGGDWKLLLSKVEDEIGSENIKHQTLGTNWRSRENIINFNNSVFQIAPKILQDEYNTDLEDNAGEYREILLKGNYDKILTHAYEDSYQFSPQNKSREGGRVKVLFFESENTRSSKSWRLDVAEYLPIFIENLLQNKNYSARDIAILVRTNIDGQEIVNLLLQSQANKARHEQYEVISQESLFISNSKSVQLLVSVLYYLNNSRNELHLTNLLYNYRKLIEQEDVELHSIFSIRDLENVKQGVLKERFDELKKMTLYSLIEQLIILFELNKLKAELPYIRALQDAALEYERNNGGSLNSFLEWWEDVGYSVAIQVSDKQDAIKIVTIHKSKGLAYKVVVIPYFDWSIDHTRNPVIWCNAEIEPFNTFPQLPLKYTGKLSKTFYSVSYYDEKLYAYMDALNMMYVAFTRAIEELVIFAPYSEVSEKKKLSKISQVLLKAINCQTLETKKENRIYISLYDKYNISAKVLEINNNYEEIDGQKFKREDGVNSYFEPSNYPVNNWEDRIAIHYHTGEFIIESIDYIGDKVNFGSLMHRVLSRIKTVDSLDNVLLDVYFTGIINLEQRESLKQKIVEIVTRQETKDWFNPKWQIITEQALLTKSGEQRIPDRILIGENEVKIIEFKFGEENELYTSQVQEYMQLLSDLNYTNIKGYLYYAMKNKIVEIKTES